MKQNFYRQDTGFTEALLDLGFAQSLVKIFSYALDAEDRKAYFHLACDENGNELDCFHTLKKFPPMIF